MAGRPSKFTDETTEIYALCCPDTGDVRYIGKARDSVQRLKTHIRDARRKNTPVYCWIRSLIAAGKFPTMRVIMTTWDWRASEIACIAQYKASGASLLNIALGGDEPYCSRDQRAVNGASTAASIHSDPFRKRIWTLKREIGQLLRDGCVSESAKDKLRLAARNNPRLFGLWACV